MSSDIRFSTTIVPFGNQTDRYVGGGYKDKNRTIEEMLNEVKKIKDITGIELVANWNINENNAEDVKSLLTQYNLKPTCLIVDTFGKAKWGKGGFTSTDSKIRKEALQHVKTFMDISEEIGCDLVDLWFGQDGYDYCFQADYIKAWNYLEEGLKECADYKKKINLAIEYKHKEPRVHCYLATIGKTAALIKKVNKSNLGVIMDIGHSLLADENPAETIALCEFFNIDLLHLHLNDNYKSWDDDMMFGSYHIQEELEALYWLKKIGYKGWYSFDIFPYREDGYSAVNSSLQWLKKLIEAVSSVSDSEIEEVIGLHDATKSTDLIRKMIFK